MNEISNPLDSSSPIYYLKIGERILFSDEFGELVIDEKQTFCVRQISFTCVSNKNPHDPKNSKSKAVIAELTRPTKPAKPYRKAQLEAFCEILTTPKEFPVLPVPKPPLKQEYVKKKWDEASTVDALIIKEYYIRPKKIHRKKTTKKILKKKVEKNLLVV